MSLLLSTLLPAILPAAVDGVKQIILKWTGGVRPTSIDEQIKLENAGVERLKALAELDKPAGTPTQWVIDLRASFRYIAAIAASGAAIVSLFVPMDEAVRQLALEYGMSASFFIFGERMYLGLKGK